MLHVRAICTYCMSILLSMLHVHVCPAACFSGIISRN
jgi:uncharacterized membrane protein